MAELVPIRVSELPEASSVSDTDLLIIDNGEQTQKIPVGTFNEEASGAAKQYANEALLSAQNAETQAQAASGAATIAGNYAKDAEAWAKGTRDGSAVPITDATHENNAKYYAQQAQNAATSAAESADAAEELLVSAIDPTLTQAGKAADAKKVGDELANLSSAIEEIEPGLSDVAKTALLTCFQKVAWIDEHGQDYYDALYESLYPGVGIEYITAVYTPGSDVIFTDDDLSVLRDNLVVTAHYSDSTSAVVESYILSGTLVAGTSRISVSYGGVSTTFTVSNVVDFYNNNTWVWHTDQLLNKVNGTFVAPSVGNNNTIRINANNPYGNSMRVFAVTKGDSAVFKNHADGSDTIYYPIPVPTSANKVTITVEPNTIYVRGAMVEYYASTQKYYSQSSVAWGQGSASGSLASVTGKRYFVPTIKATPDGETAFVNEPTSFTVTFSREA